MVDPDLVPDPDLVLGSVEFILVRPLQSGNVGAVARAMQNMGLRNLTVVAPAAFDIDRARWMAPGSTELLDGARYVGTVAEAVADCHLVLATTARGRHGHWPAHDLDSFAPLPFTTNGRVAVMFGPEDSGLSNEDLGYAHALLHIPTHAHHASINLSQAALLVAWSLFEQARQRGLVVQPPAGQGRRGGPRRGAPPGPGGQITPVEAGELEPMVEEWLAGLETAGFMRGREEVQVSATLRRILQRAELSAQEVTILRGMIRKFRWKMAHPG